MRGKADLMTKIIASKQCDAPSISAKLGNPKPVRQEVFWAKSKSPILKPKVSHSISHFKLKYTGSNELQNPQNCEFRPFLGSFDRFAGHISSDFLYIFGSFKIWNAREHNGL
jgi:hypothetical protein